MSIYEELNKNPSRRDLLSFGLVVLGGMGLAGAWLNWHSQKPSVAMGLWIAGVVVFLLALVPGVGRLLYIAWMGLGLTLGFFTSPIVMGIVYLIVVVPVGVVFKLAKRDVMRRKLDRGAASYWEDYPSTENPEQYIRQF